MLSLLQSRPTWTAEELAERLGVTTRTVRRDVTRLRDLGYPVMAAPGPFGGYQLGSGGVLPPILLSDDEAVAVAIGLRAAAQGGVSGIEDAAVSALAKLEQMLPAVVRERLRALMGATVPMDAGSGPSVEADALVTVAQGCRRPERLKFRYLDASGQPSERHVEPYRLVHVRRRWYLVARDRDRDGWRTFRVDRMQGAVLTGHRFTHAEEPDAEAMVAEGLAVASYAIQARVILAVPLQRGRRRDPPHRRHARGRRRRHAPAHRRARRRVARPLPRRAALPLRGRRPARAEEPSCGRWACAWRASTADGPARRRSGSARRRASRQRAWVSTEATPSAGRPWVCWKARTAASVPRPK